MLGLPLGTKGQNQKQNPNPYKRISEYMGQIQQIPNSISWVSSFLCISFFLSLLFFSAFLFVLSDITIVRLIFSTSCLVFPRIRHFSKGPWSPLLENGMRNHSLDANTLVLKVAREWGISGSLCPSCFLLQNEIFNLPSGFTDLTLLASHLSPAESPYVASFYLLHNQDNVSVDPTIWP